MKFDYKAMFDQHLRIIKYKLNANIPHITLPEFGYILLLFLSTRITLTFIGVLSRILLEPYHSKEYVWIYSDKLWLDIWGVWDTGWYLGIATDGYSATTNANLGSQANYNFFPLYPLFMRILGYVTGDNYLSGIIISNVALLVSCVFLYRLVELDEDRATAMRSVKFLFLFPTAFILSGVFTESLFIALLLACFYYARKGNWFFVGILGFCLSLTRAIGVLIILPVLYEYLKSKNISKDFFYLLLIPSGIFVWMVFNYFLTGDFLAFVHIQSTWGRSLANPFVTIYNGLFVTNTFDAFFAVISLSILISFYNKIRTSYWIFGMFALITPLLTSVQSMPRYALVVFPFYILFAQLTKERARDDVLTIFLALLQGCLMVFWSNGFALVI
jgi:Gpi18-like mannosyltransferase